jgi:predicted DCC family thiol-disulfide oxidoreductase YuxK
MQYHVIYDGNCNLCCTFTKLLEQFDQGKIFDYIPMQDTATLNRFNITEKDCELGMILIDAISVNNRWQGSEAADEIIHLLPLGKAFITAYRAIPGVKWFGDHTYEQVRDNRYSWFGKSSQTYHSKYAFGCRYSQENCAISSDSN